MYVLWSTIVFREFTSGEFADTSSFVIKFKLQIRRGFLPFVGHISPYRCVGNFDRQCEVEAFYPIFLVELLRIIYLAFSIPAILTQFVKNRPSTPWFVFQGLSFQCSFLPLNCSPIVRSNSTIWQFL